MVRGPLAPAQDKEIIRKYNTLTSSKIPVEEFRHWVQRGPEGCAYHALLETADGQIAGHICLIPLRTKWRGQPVLVAKAEYFFVEEKYRGCAVTGFESSFKPPAILLLERLYRDCHEQGWGPFLISAGAEIQPLHRLVGCRPVDFAVTECLLILRPWRAAAKTPNLNGLQRLAVFLVGCVQRSLWAPAAWLMRPGHLVERVPHGSSVEFAAGVGAERMALFEDEESMRWRYTEEGYVQFALEGSPDHFVIAKKGSGTGYLRVCQWNLPCHGGLTSLLLALAREARKEKALGVRWSVYRGGERCAQLAGVLKKIGFFCAPRTRRLLVQTKSQEFLTAGNWKLTDALFSFDP